MKILMFTNSLRGGGKERRLGELVKGLQRFNNGMTIEIVTMDDDIAYSIYSELNIPIHYLLRKNKKDFSVLIQLIKICREIKPDIIHTWDGMTSVYASIVSKLLGIKLVNGMITIAPATMTTFSKNKLQARLSFPFSDLILSNSNAGLISFKAPKHKSRVIYNGFDMYRISSVKDQDIVKNIYGITSKKNVCMVASFTSYKNYKLFFDVAEKIIALRDDVSFLAIGDGPQFDYYNKIVDSNKKEKIKFLGRVNDVESIINVCDVCLLFSNMNNFGEGISNSMMEYMSLKKPVIATNSGGTAELVEDNITGYLVENNDLPGLVEKLNYLLDNPSVANSMGKNAFDVIKNKFSFDNFIDAFYSSYTELLKQN
jgi:glycosyltransferase involved in cell wall biosynthesis